METDTDLEGDYVRELDAWRKALHTIPAQAERPHRCVHAICPARFATLGELRNHYRVRHWSVGDGVGGCFDTIDCRCWQ